MTETGKRIVVVGGSVAGLVGALALARSGQRVVILEKDPTPLPATPDEAFDAWERRGAPQVRHSHAFLARMYNLIRDREPELLRRLLALGAEEITFRAQALRYFPDATFEPRDDEAVLLACRRVTLEWALRQHVLATGLVEFRDGVEVTGFVADDGNGTPPRVRGVRMRVRGSDETSLAADLVVDASGRRTRLGDWLVAIGAPLPRVVKQACGIFYSSRFYRLLPGVDRPNPDSVIGADLGYMKCGIFPGDSGTFSVTLAAAPDDDPLREVLNGPGFEAAARALPMVAEWVRPEVSTPISDVQGMASLNDVRRHLVENGEPIALGIVAIGDSLAHANPITGRGCTLAWIAAYALAEAFERHPDDPRALALDLEAAVERECAPWVRAQIAQDRDAVLVNQAVRRGEDPYRFEGADGSVDPAAFARSVLRDGLVPALREDLDVLRAFLRVVHMLDAPEDLLSRPDLAARVLASHARRHERAAVVLGPSRAEMLEILARAA
ncbi:MAG: FAD-dependent monooxygenase [Myxococcota bacterium]|jgi:2-polyprenyl-6-methoxyphenol hydroxylase-like FAD-dependent oxidoreductase|nr:FAD-dependent monooxygenase [Myxococcota bacterium]